MAQAKKKAVSKTKAAAPSRPAGGGAADELWDAYCAKPGDRELLRVYADALAEAGDPRGTFINLCLVDNPTAEQQAAKETMKAKQKKLLAGPGGEFLREFEFGPNGLVARARTEAAQLIAGGDAMKTINPRLVLTVTSIKTLKDAHAFAPLKLDWLYFLDFGWITGTHGGMNLSDKQLDAIAPALEGVRHLQLSARGTPEKCFSPAGLAKCGERWKALRYLALDYYSVGLADASEYQRAVEDHFPTLVSFDLEVTNAPNDRQTSGTGLLDGGRPSRACEAQFAQGREFSDQLEAALAATAR